MSGQHDSLLPQGSLRRRRLLEQDSLWPSDAGRRRRASEVQDSLAPASAGQSQQPPGGAPALSSWPAAGK